MTTTTDKPTLNGLKMNEHTKADERVSDTAQRMRRYRQRKQKGLRYLGLEIRETEIDALITRGLLPEEKRQSNSDVLKALYRFLDRTLGAT